MIPWQRHSGLGTGLTLARQIARAHGGEVVYEPRDGGGSCFTPAPAMLPRLRSTMKTKILIVEDDPHILLGLEEVLKSEGYEVSCATEEIRRWFAAEASSGAGRFGRNATRSERL